MAEKEKKKKGSGSSAKNNTVKVVGYLKENKLERIVNSRGAQVITGSLTIATDKLSSHRIQFYVSEFMKSGEESEDYNNLLALLPENTITIASFLKENPEADFATAANAASKIWVIARFEEYASRTGERVRSMITLKGFKAGFAKADKPFTPCAEFTVDVYINELTPEVVDEEETGRIILEGLIPKYDGSVDKIDFIAGTEDGIADYIKKNYHQGDTVNLTGDVVNLQERHLVADAEDENAHFGRPASGPQYETKFIHERRICGGSTTALREGFAADVIKEGLATREIKMTENGERAMAKAQASPAAPAKPTSAPKKVETPVNSDDIDF